MSTVKTFRKKPIEIEAVEAMQWTGDNTADALRFTGNHMVDGEQRLTFVPLAWPGPRLWIAAKIPSNSRWVDVEVGDWIIKDSQGFFPCKSDRFEDSYMEVKP